MTEIAADKHWPQAVVVSRKTHRIAYECFRGVVFVHCEISRWGAAVLKAVRADMDALMALRGGDPVYCHGAAGDAKWSKFVAAMGFEYQLEVDGRQVWRRAGG